MTPIEYILSGIASAVAVALLGFVVTATTKLNRVEAILIGPDGQNGVRGNVTRIVNDIRRLQAEQTTQNKMDAVWKAGIEIRNNQRDFERAGLDKRLSVLETSD